MLLVPVIGVGALTTTVIDVVQPEEVVYVIGAEPTVTPVTTPDVRPTVATAVFPLLHVPPLVRSCNKVVPPVHMVIVPVIGAAALTDTIAVAAQPPGVP
jgi:hypothetical protein